MDFSEKLQFLRKQKNLTQEELASALFVSRTAVSKWESGRGYPSIDSLIAIAKFFGVSIDDLLTGGQALTLAREDRREAESRLRARIFGLLDLSAVLLFFLPLFAQRTGGAAASVSLLSLFSAPYLKALYCAAAASLVLSGALTLARRTLRLSLALNAAALLLFILSPQPYAAALLFVFLAIKAFFLAKKR